MDDAYMEIDGRMTIKVSTSPLLPETIWVLFNHGKPVMTVPAGAPIEDAVFDEIMVPRADYDRLRCLSGH
jgi:hypothetical protein